MASAKMVYQFSLGSQLNLPRYFRARLSNHIFFQGGLSLKKQKNLVPGQSGLEVWKISHRKVQAVWIAGVFSSYQYSPTTQNENGNQQSIVNWRVQSTSEFTVGETLFFGFQPDLGIIPAAHGWSFSLNWPKKLLPDSNHQQMCPAKAASFGKVLNQVHLHTPKV